MNVQDFVDRNTVRPLLCGAGLGGGYTAMKLTEWRFSELTIEYSGWADCNLVAREQEVGYTVMTSTTRFRCASWGMHAQQLVDF